MTAIFGNYAYTSGQVSGAGSAIKYILGEVNKAAALDATGIGDVLDRIRDYHTASIILAVLAVLFGIISIILWFRLHIPYEFGVLTGIGAARAIREIEKNSRDKEERARSGKSRRFSLSWDRSGAITGETSHRRRRTGSVTGETSHRRNYSGSIADNTSLKLNCSGSLSGETVCIRNTSANFTGDMSHKLNHSEYVNGDSASGSLEFRGSGHAAAQYSGDLSDLYEDDNQATMRLGGGSSAAALPEADRCSLKDDLTKEPCSIDYISNAEGMGTGDGFAVTDRSFAENCSNEDDRFFDEDSTTILESLLNTDRSAGRTSGDKSAAAGFSVEHDEVYTGYEQGKK